MKKVAPCVGAWIETKIYEELQIWVSSHPAWVRGLKLAFAGSSSAKSESHPAWVRGLKHLQRRIYMQHSKSHPAWVRGLKQRQY